MPRSSSQRDEFAEMYVAGLFLDADWAVYFPRKDRGFDFIVSKQTSRGMLIKPVQVKGKFPISTSSVRKTWGYTGELTAVDPTMILVMPLFTSLRRLAHPDHVAFMPWSAITCKKSGLQYSCCPAKLEKGKVAPKDTYKKYFDSAGMTYIEDPRWK